MVGQLNNGDPGVGAEDHGGGGLCTGLIFFVGFFALSLWQILGGGFSFLASPLGFNRCLGGYFKGEENGPGVAMNVGEYRQPGGQYAKG